MPFRYILKRTGMEHPVGYSLAMLALGMIVCMMAAVTISVKASERSLRESERRQCDAVASDVRGYLEVPPTTPGGKNQLRTRIELLKSWGCPVPRKGE